MSDVLDDFLTGLGRPVSRLEAGGALEVATLRWPTVRLDAEAFGRFLAARLPEGDAPLAMLHVADLLLAWACLDGQGPALAAFDGAFSPVLRQLCARAADPEDVLARLRVKLLVTEPSRPAALTGYAGLGSLMAWVSVAAMRATLNALEQARAHPEPVDAETWLELATRVADGEGPVDARSEWAQLKPHLQGALETALAALPVRQRTLLRLHYREGVSADALARSYGVHRATTTRWLADARSQVFAVVQAELRQHLALGAATLESVNRGLADGIELSFSGLLRGDEESA